MTPIERIRAAITDFPGYEGVEQRRRSDEEVRSYVGEHLAALPESAAATTLKEHAEQYDRLLARCEFMNVLAFEHFEGDPNPGRIALMLEADAELIATANDAASADADLDRLLTGLEVLLDRRDAAMLAPP